MTTEAINPKDLIGATKAPMKLVPMTAVALCAPVFAVGATKYGPMNWRQYPIQNTAYVEAAQRHLAAYADGETLDPETGLSHIAHAAAGLLILLDATAAGTMRDVRFPANPNVGEILKLVATQAKEAVEKTLALRGDAAKPASPVVAPVPAVDGEAGVVAETVGAEDGLRAEPFTRAGPPTPRVEPERSGGFGVVIWGGGVDEEGCNCVSCRTCRKERFSGLDDYRASVAVNADLRVPYVERELDEVKVHHGISKVLNDLTGTLERLTGGTVDARNLIGPEPDPFPGG